MAEIIEGMNELRRNFQKLGYAVRKQVLIEAAKAGAQIVLEAAKRMAPRLSGNLIENMRIGVIGRESDMFEGVVGVGPDRKQFYGGFQEFGTRHNRKHAFLEPALEQNRSTVDMAIKEVIEKSIEREVGGGSR